jgi:3-oxoacyl-[acyl-carrier protein] reductase
MDKAKIIFITGGSRGIGASIAERLAQGGHDIWLNYRSDHQAANLVKNRIEDLGRKCKLLPFDVSNQEEVDETLMPLLENEVPFGMVHNAGITRDTVVPMMKPEEWDLVLDVHLTSFFLMTRLVVRAMLPKRTGRIIAIASVSGETGQSGQMNYCAAKGGLIGAVKSLSREIARRNILVNVVSPGLIETDMIKDAPRDQIIKNIPLSRVGQPEEVSGIVNFLMGDEATYITGQVIGVNGGLYI